MKIYNNPDPSQWADLCRRAKAEESAEVDRIVSNIIERVRTGGDEALMQLAAEIDGLAIPYDLAVSETEFAEAEAAVSDSLKAAIRTAADNISAFHQAQLPSEVCVETMPGVTCIQKPVAIQNVGIYIPGGTAPLFSTVLMLAIPARIAGCRRVVMTTPCDKEGKVAPAVLYAARVCGVDEVYKIGGAQAISALAYGTESIRPVDKIFGPGNRFVTSAKQQVGGRKVSIDMPAGPSEVMILADDTAVPEFVASDILSQCEHGADSQGIVVCYSMQLAEKIREAIEFQASTLHRAEYVSRSLENSRIVVLPERNDMIAFANLYGAEHLIISLHDAMQAADGITAAGSVFIGNYSPESAGDYASGTNHTLPTSGWAHSCSGVNIDSYMRKTTIQYLTQEGLARLADTITTMADAEGLEAHAQAVKIRMQCK
ncbi:MAG: histidinol dehydrogenase [Muribaculaceae bacterium]|nr:histidinol dehydrogenase [Muribaculaceae bacterium]